MMQVQQKLDEDLTKATMLIKRKIFFDDTQNEAQNKANVPSFDRKRELKKIDIVNSGLDNFRHLISHFCDYFTAFHERLLLMNKSTTISDDLRNIHRKVCLSSLKPLFTYVCVPDDCNYSIAYQVPFRCTQGPARPSCRVFETEILSLPRPRKECKLPQHMERANSYILQRELVKSIQKFVLFNKKLLTYELLRYAALIVYESHRIYCLGWMQNRDNRVVNKQ